MFERVTERPAHVPESLVREYPIKFGVTIDENPFDKMIPNIQKEFPDVFFSMDVYPGGSPGWVLKRSEDLRSVYFDTEHYSSKDFAPFAKLIGETWSELPAETDPPMHQLYRSFVNPIFTPKAVAALDEKIRLYARQHIESFKDRGACEFLKEFAFEFPIKVFLELMDMPLEMTAQFLAWEMDLLHTNSLPVIAGATRKVVDYLRGEIAARRVNPGDDFISYGIKTQLKGRALTDDELVGFAFNLFVGGLDTVSTNMAWQMRHIASHPAHQKTLRDKQELIPDAIEEMMRCYGAVTTFRTCFKETSVRGVKIMPGDKVAMATSLAGRDPLEFANPDEVVLDRKPRHVSFGYGPHLCVGMHLARREMRIALAEFLSTLPEIRITPGQTIPTHLGGMLQPATLPLEWN